MLSRMTSTPSLPAELSFLSFIALCERKRTTCVPSRLNCLVRFMSAVACNGSSLLLCSVSLYEQITLLIHSSVEHTGFFYPML